MSKSDAFETAVLKLFFNATPIANIADNAASSPLTNLYISLHTADPGEAGTEATNEATYGGYARVPVARTTGGWTVTGNSVSPVADILFPPWASGATNTITHWGVGVAASGASMVMYSGTYTPNATVQAGVQPKVSAGSTITED